MNLEFLFQWFREHWAKLDYVFGYGWDKFYNWLEFGPDQTRSLIQYALNYAWSIATQKAEDAYLRSFSLYSSLAQQFTSTWQSLATTINTKFDQAERDIKSALSTAQSYTIALFNNAVKIAQNLTDKVYPYVDGAISSVKQIIALELAPFKAMKDGLTAITTFFDADKRGKLDTFLNNDYPKMLQFLTNPKLFILSLIWSVFQTMLCYALAYGMGSTIYDLDEPPTWDETSDIGIAE